MRFLKRLLNQKDNIDDSHQVSSESFDVLKYLDEGSYGKVYQVRKKQGKNKGNIYAMKILDAEKYAKTPNGTEKALKEGNVLGSLQHPFIVKLVYSFQSKAQFCMVMEYASGGSLDGILEREKRFKEQEAAFYIKEMILAIEYIHFQNVIHRDIKPGNILIDESGHAKLSDFGSCTKDFSPHPRANSYCGTILFMAPEMLKEHESGYGQEVDWWALGVLFYTMLIGKYPFMDEITLNLMEKINVGVKYSLPSGKITKEAESLIRGLLDIGAKSRLGYVGASEIKSHRFFRGTDWFGVYNCLEKPPFMPGMETNDNQITQERRCDHICPCQPD